MENSNRLFLHKVIKSIADSVIKIFIPLYILKTTQNIHLSIIYLIVFSLLGAILQVIFTKIYKKHLVLLILLQCIPMIIAHAILSFSKINIITIIICALLMALNQAMYSTPINILFSLNDKKTNVAKFQIATNTGKILFIIMSGLLLSKIQNSFIFLSGISSILYIISVLPICKFYNLKHSLNPTNIQTNYSCSFSFRLFHISFSLFQITIESLLPLYLYVNNLSFEAITTIIALVELLKILTNLIAKKLVEKKLLKLSCITSFIIFLTSTICILFFKHPVILYIFSSTIAISFPLTFVPLFYIFCKQTKNIDTNIYDNTLRDVDIFAPRALYYGLYFVGGFLAPMLMGIASSISMLACQINIINSHKNII